MWHARIIRLTEHDCGEKGGGSALSDGVGSISNLGNLPDACGSGTTTDLNCRGVTSVNVPALLPQLQAQ